MANVKHIPDGHHTLTPYLLLENVAGYIEFLKRAFGAKEIHRSSAPDGTVAHATIQIGDSMLMMGAARGDWKPQPTMLYMYVEDVDQAYRQAVEAGATSVQEPINQFYGDRSGGVKDSAGNSWWIATHIEDVPPEELQKRFQAFSAQQAGGGKAQSA